MLTFIDISNWKSYALGHPYSDESSDDSDSGADGGDVVTLEGEGIRVTVERVS